MMEPRSTSWLDITGEWRETKQRSAAMAPRCRVDPEKDLAGACRLPAPTRLLSALGRLRRAALLCRALLGARLLRGFRGLRCAGLLGATLLRRALRGRLLG